MKNIVNKKYKSNCHQKYRTRYHFIFSTKYRKKCLKGIEAETELAFRYSESISDYKILYFGIDKDHVHLLVEFKPSLSIGQVVNRMKSITTNELWKNKKLLWTHGYFAETTGNVSEANIAEYILEQGLK